MALPASGGAEPSYLIAQVSFKSLVVTFNDDTKCGLHVSVRREGSTAMSCTIRCSKTAIAITSWT